MALTEEQEAQVGEAKTDSSALKINRSCLQETEEAILGATSPLQTPSEIETSGKSYEVDFPRCWEDSAPDGTYTGAELGTMLTSVRDSIESLSKEILALKREIQTLETMREADSEEEAKAIEEDYKKSDAEIKAGEAGGQTAAESATQTEEFLNNLENLSFNDREKLIEQAFLLGRIQQLVEARASWWYNYTGIPKISAVGPANKQAKLALPTYPKREGFGGPWIMPIHGTSNKLVNKLTWHPSTQQFYDLTPAQLSYLVPKIKIYKVLFEYITGTRPNHKEHKLNEPVDFPVPFYTHMTTEMVDDIFHAQSAKGGGVAIESFNWNYQGSNPFSASRDITATLKIKAQDFNELVRDRDFHIQTWADGDQRHSFRYVDLAMRTTEYPDKAPDTVHYKLKVVLGWGIQDGTEGYFDEKQVKAVNNTAVSMFLTIVDHSFNVNDDATIDFTISYRGYLEAAFQNPNANILMSQDLIESQKERKEIEKLAFTAIKDGGCEKELLNTVRQGFAKVMNKEKMIAYRSLIASLVESQRVYQIAPNKGDIRQFLADPFDGTARSISAMTIETSGTVLGLTDAVTGAVQAADVGEESNTYKDVFTAMPITPPGSDILIINFFYLGDLIDVCLENVIQHLDQSDPDQEALFNEFKRTRIVTGPLEIEHPQTGDKMYANIVDIPISVNYFMEWFMARVLKQQKVTWKLMDFIRDLMQNLVVNVLNSKEFFGSNVMRQKLRYRQLIAASHGSSEPLEYILSKKWDSSPAIPISIGRLDTESFGGMQPVLTVSAHEAKRPTEVYHYIIIYGADAVPDKGKGDACDDFQNGIPHFEIGRNKGVVKSIKFNKADSVGIREARYFSGGFDDLVQLREPYSVTVTMYGNARIVPGTLIYIDPTGLGPGNMGMPDEDGTFAWTFGFGGYHLVIDVKHTISSGLFETVIRSNFLYRGSEGEGKQNAQGNQVGKTPCNSQANEVLKRTDKYIKSFGS